MFFIIYYSDNIPLIFCDPEDDGDDGVFRHHINFNRRVQQPATDWCTCDRCHTMEVPLMNFCCQELTELEGRIFAGDLDCVTQHMEFPLVVLEEAVLRTALIAMKDVKKTSLKEPIKERSVCLYCGFS